MIRQIFEIEPYQCAGEIRLGQPRPGVRTALGSEYVEFRKSVKSINTTDHYEQLGVFVYYDTADLVEAIEFASPADVHFDAMPLLTMPSRAVTEHIKRIDPGLILEDDGFISTKLGIGAYMPDGPLSESDLPESILIFRLGYYD